MLNHLQRVQKIKEKLDNLGPILPGTISTQWNVCGKSGCRCKDKKKPKKHGPYYQLSFSIEGKSSSMFIKKHEIAEVKDCQKRYKQFRELNNELIRTYIAWMREQRKNQTIGGKQ